MAVKKLKVGVAGLGRIGKRHAINFLQSTARAELVAVASQSTPNNKWAHERLSDHGVIIYPSFDEMLKHDKIEAVCIASPTAVHSSQVTAALNVGKHVFCEKPLAISDDQLQAIIDAASRRPDLKVFCGFTRRFDESYRDAHAKVQAGMIGRPSIFRGQTCDKLDPRGEFVTYAKISGGIFVDSAIHDIDLALWFLSYDSESEVKAVTACGIRAVHSELSQFDDYDNAVGVIEFVDGRIATLYCSRMMAAGQDDATEVIGTEGKISVSTVPTANSVLIHGSDGVRHEVPQTSWERYQAAFTGEANDFTACCLDGNESPIKLATAVAAVRIAKALQKSLVLGQKLEFNV